MAKMGQGASRTVFALDRPTVGIARHNYVGRAMPALGPWWCDWTRPQPHFSHPRDCTQPPADLRWFGADGRNLDATVEYMRRLEAWRNEHCR